MSDEFALSMADGPPEERACFGQLAIVPGPLRLLEGQCDFTGACQPGPRVAGYQLAERRAWNWWRFGCEPRPSRRQPDRDWLFSHDMSTIGEGFLWPPIQIWSDRERTILQLRPTQDGPSGAFRFTTSLDAILPTAGFQRAVEGFVQQMLDQLAGKALARKQPSPYSAAGTPWPFLLADAAAQTRHTVLTARYRAGGRFALARLLVHRLTTPVDEPPRPATDTRTWRQQLQRAFAAEFLCPFAALRDRLDGDFADDTREQAARHVQVSARTVTTMLVNHGLIDRDELTDEPDLAAA